MSDPAQAPQAPGWRWLLVAAVVAAAQPAGAAPHVDYQASFATALSAVSDLAVDEDGSVWLVGTTTDHLLPVTAGAADSRFDGDDSQEGFVLKFDPLGALVYASYIGGGDVDDLASIAIDDVGSVYLAGTTYSDDFPVTPGAYRTALASEAAEDAFLVKLDRDGTLVAATYFGGNCRDLFPGGTRGNPGVAVALAPPDALYLAGGTCSTDLPTQDGYQRQYGGGSQDAFLARFDRGLGFLRCTYLGGENNEGAYRVAVDADGDVFLLGLVTRFFGQAWSFPTTPGALLSDPASEPYDFVARFDPSGNLVYATFLGPSSGDGHLSQYHGDLAVDASGNAYVVGVASSPTWPTTPGALQPTLRGASDLIVSKVSPDGTHLLWATYFGGSAAEYANSDQGARIAIGADGLYIAGNTDSGDLPLPGAFETTRSGGFVARLSTDGDLLYSSFVLPYAFGADALVAGRHPSGPPAEPPYIGVYVAGRSATNNAIADGLDVVGISDLGTPPPDCLGDCDGDGAVQINELILGVNIALGQSAAALCPLFDPDGDGQVGIADLIGAVGSALGGCAVAAGGTP